jgi:hypothetical protein
MKLRTLCILVILISILLVVVPVFGFTDSPQGGNDTDVLDYTNTFPALWAPNQYSSDAYIQKIRFKKIEAYTNFVSLRYYGGWSGYNWTVENTSKLNDYTTIDGAQLKYGNYTVGYGRLGYSIDTTNLQIYIYYWSDYWNPYVGYYLNGTVDLNLTWNRSQFNLNHQIYLYGSTGAINSSDYDVVFMSYQWILPGYATFDRHEVQGQSLMNIKYIRDVASVVDTFYIDRHSDTNPTPTYSTINLSYSSDNGSTWTSVYNAYENTDLELFVPNGTVQRLWILSPVSGRYFLYQWNKATVGNCSGGNQLTVNTWDGSDGAQLGGTTISFINTTNYIGNISVLAPTGTYLFCLPAGYDYDVGASKTGYEGVNTTWHSSSYIGDQIDFWLYPVTNDTFNGTASFVVNDVYGTPISNAQIRNENTNETKITNNVGYTKFLVNRTATYSYKASKYGYNPNIVDVTLGGAASKLTEIRLNSTVIPTATIPVTTVVTPTLPPGTGEAATQEVSSIFFNAAGAIAILTVLAILLGLVDIMGGQRRRRR